MSTGDTIVRNALATARRNANRRRLRGFGDNAFSEGMCLGKVIIASLYLDADPLLVMAAENEMCFLTYYSESRP